MVFEYAKCNRVLLVSSCLFTLERVLIHRLESEQYVSQGGAPFRYGRGGEDK